MLETEHAGWSPRAYHGVVVFQDKLWVIGGGNYLAEYWATNDVWCSEDGKNWTCVTEQSPWHPRIWFSSVAYRGQSLADGGLVKNARTELGRCLAFADGRNWKELKSDVIWKARHEHSTYVHRDRIFVAGGHARPLSNEVWSLQLPADWTGK